MALPARMPPSGFWLSFAGFFPYFTGVFPFKEVEILIGHWLRHEAGRGIS